MSKQRRTFSAEFKRVAAATGISRRTARLAVRSARSKRPRPRNGPRLNIRSACTCFPACQSALPHDPAKNPFFWWAILAQSGQNGPERPNRAKLAQHSVHNAAPFFWWAILAQDGPIGPIWPGMAQSGQFGPALHAPRRPTRTTRTTRPFQQPQTALVSPCARVHLRGLVSPCARVKNRGKTIKG